MVRKCRVCGRTCRWLWLYGDYWTWVHDAPAPPIGHRAEVEGMAKSRGGK